MRARLQVVSILGLGLVLSACGGSAGSSGSPVASDAACSGTGCERDNPVPAAPLICGGVSGATCPQGYRCVDDPSDTCDPATGADCGGTCMLGEELPRCGGVGGEPCAAGSVCVEDPSDTCTGGPAIDCPGICRPKAEGQCSADADCPFLGVAACSMCADGSATCPHTRCDNGQCTVEFKACPEPQSCGGIAGLSCAAGFQCADDPTDACVPDKGGADCPGICIPPQEPRCNGITGATCPPGLICVDEPNDMCDPQVGGADCPGVCKPEEGGQCATDAECPQLRAPCGACADGTAACPRSFCEGGRCTVVVPTCPMPVPIVCGANGSGCQPGDVCVSDPNNVCDPATGSTCPGICFPSGQRPCGGMVGATCPVGFTCVDDQRDDCTPDANGTDCPGVCEATAPPPQCHADDECATILAACRPCPNGAYACPRPQCKEGMCTVLFDACGPGFCGGIAGFPCPPGSTCVDDPMDDCDPQHGGADCGGICVREEEPSQCGGLTAKPCPAGFECVDDPRDDCNPDASGADCPGICKAAPNPVCMSDADCPAIGAPCRLCDDGTAACPRSFCENGVCKAEFQTCKT